jgi:hypothetical protein
VTRRVPPPDREGVGLIAVVLLLAAALALAALLASCGAPGITCPLGTYPVAASREQKGAGGVDAGVSVPTASGTAGGRWDTSGRAAWSCERICPEGTGIKLHESARGKRLECLPVAAAPVPRELKRLERATPDGGPGQ